MMLKASISKRSVRSLKYINNRSTYIKYMLLSTDFHNVFYIFKYMYVCQCINKRFTLYTSPNKATYNSINTHHQCEYN